jgi:hypothetical protein
MAIVPALHVVTKAKSATASSVRVARDVRPLALAALSLPSEGIKPPRVASLSRCSAFLPRALSLALSLRERVRHGRPRTLSATAAITAPSLPTPS